MRPTPTRPPPTHAAPILVEYRCPRCTYLLIRALLQPGSEVETYCPKCRIRPVFVVPQTKPR